jgi:hypothetical protein
MCGDSGIMYVNWECLTELVEVLGHGVGTCVVVLCKGYRGLGERKA